LKYTSLALLALSFIEAWATPAHAVASAELIRNQAYVFGRFEARVRFAPGDGVVSSFFLWKSGSEATGAYWNELDFEKLGADCHLQTNALYGAPVADHSQTNSVAGDLCGDYHTYAFEWTPTAIAWLVDGVELRRENDDIASAFAENATAGMQIHLNIWPGDASFGGNFDSAILPVRQYVSWVQYSSYADGVFTPKWHEDFDATTLPSGWSTGNWSSPKGYSTHSASNVTFASSIAALSLTADSSTGFSGTPPVDDAAGGSPSAGGAGSLGGTSQSSVGGSSAVSSETAGATAATSSVASGTPSDDSGCGCRTLRSTHRATNAAWLLLVLGIWGARWRRSSLHLDPG
jgi:endo-1,3-1,4-beta-glycanase ExoK